jgi:hypothetical protein
VQKLTFFHLWGRWDSKDEIAAEVREEMVGLPLLDRSMMAAVAVAVDSVVVVAVVVVEMVMGASCTLEIWPSRLRVRTCANTLGRCDLCKLPVHIYLLSMIHIKLFFFIFSVW